MWSWKRNTTYGQKLSDSHLTDGSTEYGTFAWASPATVPPGGTAGYSVIFTPSAATQQNYEDIATKTQDINVTVAQATPTVTAAVKLSGSPGSRTAELTVTVTGAQNGVAPTGEITITGNGETKKLTLTNGTAIHQWNDLADQEYTVQAEYSGDTNYTDANGSLTFNAAKQQQAPLSIKDVGTKIYGDAPFTLNINGGSGEGAVTFTSSDPSVLSISGNTATIHKAGPVTITVIKAADNNYNEAEAALSLTIGERPITVTADSFTVVTGGDMPIFTYKTTGLVNGDTFTAAPTMKASVADTSTLGEYDIVISGGVLKNGDSYKITYVNGKLIITDKTPVNLTMTASPDALTGSGTVTLTISGLPTGGAVVVSCSDSRISVTGSGATWRATLPNETATYTFTANYAGDAQHSSGTASCAVSVTKGADSGGSGNGGGTGGSGSSGDSGSSDREDRPSTPAYDKETLSKDGVTLSGDRIHENARLTVTENRLHTSGSCDHCSQIRQWQQQGSVVAVYDVSLSRDFRGSVTLTFPVPSRYNGKTMTVVHCLHNKLEYYEAVAKNGKVTVTVESLSPFAILEGSIAKKNPETGGILPIDTPAAAEIHIPAAQPEVMVPNQTPAGSGIKETAPIAGEPAIDPPQTEDRAVSGAFAAAIAALLIALGGVWYWKKRRTE